MNRSKIASEANSKCATGETTPPSSKYYSKPCNHVLLNLDQLINHLNLVKFSSKVDQPRSTNTGTDDDSVENIPPNENILQLVAQIPNHPLQKFAQKLLVDRPKAISESHSKNASDDTTPPKTNSPTTSTS